MIYLHFIKSGYRHSVTFMLPVDMLLDCGVFELLLFIGSDSVAENSITGPLDIAVYSVEPAGNQALETMTVKFTVTCAVI